MYLRRIAWLAAIIFGCAVGSSIYSFLATADDQPAVTDSTAAVSPDSALPDSGSPDPGPLPDQQLEIDAQEQALIDELRLRTAAWAEVIVQLQHAQMHYNNGPLATMNQYRDLFRELEPESRRLYEELLAHVVTMLEARPGGAPILWDFVVRTMEHRGRMDWYEGLGKPALMLAQVLNEGELPKFPSVAARALICEGMFEEARPFLEKMMQVQEPDEQDIRLLVTLDVLQESWQAEQERLANDPDDLPLVELQTTRGRVLIELYEDQAPNTVANFVQLVEEGFYDGLAFYQVLDRLFAMTGDPFGDGTGDSGHKIPDESDHPDARSSLRGSLVMAKLAPTGSQTGETIPDTASSQLMILLLPITMDTGQYTVFGRVTEGMDAISYLNRQTLEGKSEDQITAPPDRIVTATVIRKRDHDYAVRYVAPPQTP